jgi:hypothetical protein
MSDVSARAGESNTLINEKSKDIRSTNIIAAKGKSSPRPLVTPNLLSLRSCRRCRAH